MGGGTHTVTSHQHHQGRGAAHCHTAHLKLNRMGKRRMGVYVEICHGAMEFLLENQHKCAHAVTDLSCTNT